MKTFQGLCGIKVTVLADSITKAGIRMLSFEIEYPRLVLAELNTHRALSRNSFSSRAVPFDKMLDNLSGRPVRFGANQAGMQDKGEDFDASVDIGRALQLSHNFEATNCAAWEAAKISAIRYARAFKEAGYHKQVYNRLLEPFQMMKTIISGTELPNFFWLRDDDATDPTLRELARVMLEARDDSAPRLLAPGQWHLPYIDCDFSDNPLGSSLCHPKKASPYSMVIGEKDGIPVRQLLSVDDAIKVSCARCASVSYRNEGYGLVKSREIYVNLVDGDKKHASAFEHCATPMNVPEDENTDRGVLIGGRSNNVPPWPDTWQRGVSHMDRDGNLWSGNIKGFIQYRKLIPGENHAG